MTLQLSRTAHCFRAILTTAGFTGTSLGVTPRKQCIKSPSQNWRKRLAFFGRPDIAAAIHHAFVVSGYGGARQQYAKELESLIATKQAYRPVDMSEIYGELGDKDHAFYWREDAYKHRDMHSADFDLCLEWINAEPMLDSLRSDPRFKDLLRRLGIPR
jgi:hypothetical protein